MRTVLILITLFFANAALAQPLRISELNEHAFVFTTYKKLDGTLFPSNGLYLVSDSGLIIIDSPWDTTQFEPLLDTIENRHHKPVRFCIATHYHDDRTAAMAYFRSKGIATYASQQTMQLCKTQGQKQPEFSFTSDTVFQLGNLTVETYYPGEGHTRDNIVIWVAGDRMLYGGCLVKSTENNSMGFVDDSNLKEWPHTITKLMAKYPDVKIVIPGHFKWGNKKALKHTLTLLRKS